MTPTPFPIARQQQDREDLCRRCGASCHLPVKVGEEKIIVPELHCTFLSKPDAQGKFSCTVYEQRFEKAPWCHTADDAMKEGQLAQDCPYAAGVPGFKGKKWADEPTRARLVPILRQRLIDEGLPVSASPDSALRLLTSDGEEWTYSLAPGKYVFHRVITSVPFQKQA